MLTKNHQIDFTALELDFTALELDFTALELDFTALEHYSFTTKQRLAHSGHSVSSTNVSGSSSSGIFRVVSVSQFVQM
jgi:hypothetical protein